MICGSGVDRRSQARQETAAGAEPADSSDESMKIARRCGVKHDFWSQNRTKHLSFGCHFAKYALSDILNHVSSTSCGAKHIVHSHKISCATNLNTMLRDHCHLWKYEMSKKCTPLMASKHISKSNHVRKTHISYRSTFRSCAVETQCINGCGAKQHHRSQHVQNTEVRTRVWTFRCCFCDVQAQGIVLTIVKVSNGRWWVFVAFSTTCHLLHHTTLQGQFTLQTSLQLWRLHLHYIPLHYAPLHSSEHYTTLNYTQLHSISTQITLHYRYTTLHYTTLHYNYSLQLQLQLHYTTLGGRLHYTTLHNGGYTTQLHNTLTLDWNSTLRCGVTATLIRITLHVHYATLSLGALALHHITLSTHYTATNGNCNYTTLITLHHNYNSTTLQLQLQLHYNTLHPAVVGEVTDQVTTATIAATPKKNSSNHLSVHQWIRSAIRDSQQPISPIGFLFLKLQPPLHHTTLQYTTLHFTTTTPSLHSTTLHSNTLHYTTLHSITLNYIQLHSITLHYTTLH